MTIKEKVRREVDGIGRDYYTKGLRGVSEAADRIMKACQGEDYWRVKKFAEKRDEIEDCIHENLSGDYYSSSVRGDKDEVVALIRNILEK